MKGEPLHYRRGHAAPIALPEGLDLVWLAGLLEGEASFMPLNGGKRACIDLWMSDRDVVERAAKLMGGLKVGRRKPGRPGWKPLYGARLSGYRAGKLMRALRPHMGQRRQAQIDAALAVLFDQ